MVSCKTVRTFNVAILPSFSSPVHLFSCSCISKSFELCTLRRPATFMEADVWQRHIVCESLDLDMQHQRIWLFIPFWLSADFETGSIITENTTHATSNLEIVWPDKNLLSKCTSDRKSKSTQLQGESINQTRVALKLLIFSNTIEESMFICC